MPTQPRERVQLVKRMFGISTLGLVLLILLILLVLGAFPAWPYAASWGYGPSGILGLILIIVIVLLVLGRL